MSARLQAKRAVEKQYTGLLSKTQRAKDILDIKDKLGQAWEEIEATESCLEALNSEVTYSTNTLTLYQPLPQAVPDAPLVSLGSRAVEAFYGGWQLLASLLIGAPMATASVGHRRLVAMAAPPHQVGTTAAAQS